MWSVFYRDREYPMTTGNIFRVGCDWVSNNLSIPRLNGHAIDIEYNGGYLNITVMDARNVYLDEVPLEYNRYLMQDGVLIVDGIILKLVKTLNRIEENYNILYDSEGSQYIVKVKPEVTICEADTTTPHL